MSKYERDRLSRYRNVTTRQKYSAAEFTALYQAWSKKRPGERYSEWCDYCDARDGMPPGTNAQIIFNKELSLAQELNIN